MSPLSELLDDAELDAGAQEVAQPPGGCEIREEGPTIRIIASGQSIGSGCGFLFSCVLWNGIVSVFVLEAIASTLHHILGSVPSWIPSQSGNPMPVWGVIGLWLFLVPFITIGLMLAGSLLTTMFGRVEVRVRGDEGTVLIGVGPICWRRRFDALSVERVQISGNWKSSEESCTPRVLIKLTNGNEIRFGSILTKSRRRWMMLAVRELLVIRDL